MSYNCKTTGLIIARLRNRKGISQSTLSDFAHISRSHLTAIENGQKIARVDTLAKIANVLDIRLSELIRLMEEEEATALHRADKHTPVNNPEKRMYQRPYTA